MNARHPAFTGRLIKLLGILGSPHDGEVLNAARLAARLVHDADLTWNDVIAADAQPPAQVSAFPVGDPPDATWRQQIRAIERQIAMLAPWERNFISHLKELHRLSDKQRQAVEFIYQKVAYRRAHVG